MASAAIVLSPFIRKPSFARWTVRHHFPGCQGDFIQPSANPARVTAEKKGEGISAGPLSRSGDPPYSYRVSETQPQGDSNACTKRSLIWAPSCGGLSTKFRRLLCNLSADTVSRRAVSQALACRLLNALLGVLVLCKRQRQDSCRVHL